MDFDARSIEAFSRKMLERLDANLHKGRGGWLTKDRNFFVRKLGEEYAELLVAMGQDQPEAVTLEAADLANTCMMISDVFGARR